MVDIFAVARTYGCRIVRGGSGSPGLEGRLEYPERIVPFNLRLQSASEIAPHPGEVAIRLWEGNGRAFAGWVIGPASGAEFVKLRYDSAKE